MEAPTIIDRLGRDLESFRREATAIRELAGTAQPKFYMSLYALLMGVFSQVDLLSRLWNPSERDQTKRMVSFLQRFTQRPPSAIRIAVQLYRHTLMHTGRPRELEDRSSGRRHYFLLHWGVPPADPAAHFTVNGEGKLTLNLEYLIDDLIGAFALFTRTIESDPQAAERLVAAWPSIALQPFDARAV